MADSFLGEIRTVAFNFTPEGWAACDGRMLSKDDYPDLFSLIGTTYGGDGQPMFALPDLQGRIPIAAGQGRGLSERKLGEAGGQETVTLAEAELPQHTHTFNASIDVGNTNKP